jgi:hypothetical protein
LRQNLLASERDRGVDRVMKTRLANTRNLHRAGVVRGDSCQFVDTITLWRLFLPTAWALTAISAAALDLKQAAVVMPRGLSGPEQKAVTMLIQEVEKRTHLQWPETNDWPGTSAPVIVVGTGAELKQLGALALSTGRGAGVGGEQGAPPAPGNSGQPAEGYHLLLRNQGTRPVLYVRGNDPRGVLFGVGRLLRELEMHPGRVAIGEHLDIVSAPKYALRGHQLGYRPKCNTYDAWDLPSWEQYYRDLAVFGCNAVELIPPRSDDAAYSPHFPRPPLEMMEGMSRLADEYGLDVWIWYPAMDRDYSDPKTVEAALREWGKVFARLPRVDAVFVPGGDPGHTSPRVLLAFLEKQSENLRRYHPKGRMWVSPQSFDQAWMEEFLRILNRDQPAWLAGVVFGPQVRIPLPRLRELVPAKYPIRHYPDITHSRQCQYPVPDWDVAYAVTEARECINPRPEGEAEIFQRTAPYTIGFITYSEGCNDDVNKCIWSALGWDPNASVLDILRQYSRYFIGCPDPDAFAQGLLSLERDWQGPLLANPSVDTTLAQFQELEKTASPAMLRNWRFQQALFRAYYDAYIRHRLIWETDLEAQAMEQLRSAPRRGALPAIAAAEQILDRTTTRHVNADWRERIEELGEALFQSIGMQLSVEKYKASDVDRGASLDTLDFPLNDRRWLEERFAAIRKMTGEPERLDALAAIVNWTNPGPGGFYDDLGDSAQEPHLIRGPGFAEDPGGLDSARSGFEEDLVVDDPDEAAGLARRVSWIDHAEPLYDTPLRMRYTRLDPHARYKLRVVYGGDSPRRKIRLVANGQTEIHPYMAKPVPFRPLEFPIPPAATAQGQLDLSWSGEPGLGGNGRGCQVSEVWLMKEEQK